MNPFQLKIPTVRVDLPVNGIIDATTLQRYLGVAAVMARTRSRAAALLRQVRKQRAQARADAAALLEEARREGDARAAMAAKSAHDAVVGDVVAWLVAERDLEACVAARMAAHCRAWVAQTIAQFAGEADRSELIAARIDAQIRKLAQHGGLTVRVAPDALERVGARLSGPPPFELIADSELRAGEACLDSPYVHLRIDLDRHLDDLLRQIRGEADATAGTATAGASLHQMESNGE